VTKDIFDDRCGKCGASSGGDWSQCHGACPIRQSPHYSRECELKVGSEREVDASVAAQLLGSLSGDPVGAVRSVVEAAIAIAAPAQRQLGRIANGETPSSPEMLRTCLGDLEVARQLFALAVEALRVAIEDPRPTSSGGTA